MALKKEQIELIIALVKKGSLSNVEISKKANCSESAVRTTIKKYGVKKNEITDLAKSEVQSILIQNEIKTRKNELTRKERDIYDRVLLEEAQSKNLALNANHMLLEKIYNSLEDGTKDEKINVGAGVQQIEPVRHNATDFNQFASAIQKTTDNLGITDRHAPKIDINNTNAQQNIMTPNEITKAISEALPD